MTTPLALFLTSFSAPPLARIMAEPSIGEPMVTMTRAELDARLMTAAETARLDAERDRDARLAARDAAHAAEVAQTIAAARADWVAAEGEQLGGQIATKMQELRAVLEERIAAVIRPLLADAVLARTQKELMDALDRLTADPDHPALSIRGPADLLAVLRRTYPAQAIAWIEDRLVEISVVAGATRIETRQGAALAALEETEA